MIIFLYGPDTFRSLKKLREFKNKFITEVNGGSLNLSELDGEKISFADFRKEAATASFLASKRMVAVKNISNNKNKDLQKEIVEFLKTDNLGDVILIFWENKKDDKDILCKYLLSLSQENKKFYKQEFSLLDNISLKKWIREVAGAKGGAIDVAAVNLLSEMVGNNLWQMNNELDKLVSISSQISMEIIKKMVKTKYDENIFNLTDAIGSRNKKLALKLLGEQLMSGANINYILTMLLRQYRILIEVKDYLASACGEYISRQVISRDLKLHPFAAGKFLQQEKKYRMEELKKFYSKIIDIDLKSKTSGADIELLLDLLIAS